MPRVTDDGPTPEIALPIAPMLDLSFQLLFFFVITYNPIPYIEGQMDMNLPLKQESQGEANEESNPKEVDPSFPLDFTILIRSSKDPGTRGLITQLSLKKGNAGVESLDADLGTAIKQLQDRLRAGARKPEEKDDPNQPDLVKVEMEKDLKWGEMVKIMDAVEQTGFQVSFVVPEELR